MSNDPGDETKHRHETIKERIDREVTEGLGHPFDGPISSSVGGLDPFSGAPMPIPLEPVSKLDAAYRQGFSDGKQDATQYFTRVEVNNVTEVPKPGPWTQKAIGDVTLVLGARGHSYTVDEEFENFFKQAEVGEQTIRQVFRGALGQKLHRERATRQRIEELFAVEHETLEHNPELEKLYLQWLDSIRDICGYALLFFGWAKSQVEEA